MVSQLSPHSTIVHIKSLSPQALCYAKGPRLLFQKKYLQMQSFLSQNHFGGTTLINRPLKFIDPVLSPSVIAGITSCFHRLLQGRFPTASLKIHTSHLLSVNSAARTIPLPRFALLSSDLSSLASSVVFVKTGFSLLQICRMKRWKASFPSAFRLYTPACSSTFAKTIPISS